MAQKKPEKSESHSDAEASPKTAFIVTPIGPDNSDVRRATDGLVKSVLRPALEAAFYRADVSHEEDDLGSISRKIIDHLLNDDLVVVNLTELNANVMYELGIRHATLKPVILIAEQGTRLPFDAQDQRTIMYKNDMMGVQELRARLESILKSEEKLEDNSGNPIFMTAKDNVINNALSDKLSGSDATEEEKGVIELVLQRMETFESRVMSMINRPTDAQTISKAGALLRKVNAMKYVKLAEKEVDGTLAVIEEDGERVFAFSNGKAFKEFSKSVDGLDVNAQKFQTGASGGGFVFSEAEYSKYASTIDFAFSMSGFPG